MKAEVFDALHRIEGHTECLIEKNRESVGMISRLPLFCDNEQIDYFLASSAIECTK